MTLDNYLLELEEAEDQPRLSLLINLSSLDDSETETFKTWWASISPGKRIQLIDDLVTTAEENVELDFEVIFKHALSDPEPQVKQKAISGLWESNDRMMIVPLMNLLRCDSSENVRASAAIALGKFSLLAHMGEIPPTDGTSLEKLLLEVIENPEETAEVRSRSLQAVAPLNSPQVREVIRKAYFSIDPKLRLSSLYAMGKTAEAEWLSILMAEIHSENPETRYEVAIALAEIGEEDAVTYLVPLIHDRDSEVQLAAVYALGSIGGSLAEQTLKACLTDDDETIQEAAKDALEELEGDEDPLGFKFHGSQ